MLRQARHVHVEDTILERTPLAIWAKHLDVVSAVEDFQNDSG